MRIILVNMPWALIQSPSLALGILTRVAGTAGSEIEVETIHANLDYVDWIAEREEFTLHDYLEYSNLSYRTHIGDWVFSSALYDDPEWRVDEWSRLPGSSAERLAHAIRLHRLAPEFIADLAARIVAAHPDLVGFTSTFQQNTAVLAAARAVKLAAPATRTALGGANCDGGSGIAIHQHFPFVDYVVRGEGEVSLPPLIRAVARGAPDAALAEIPGLCWRSTGGDAVANPVAERPSPAADLVAPDFGAYFERLEASRAGAWVEPRLVVESSRGCWWGQKHHCRFCGLNGSSLAFRSKDPAVFQREVLDLVRRHQVLDVVVSDNILDPGYLTSVMPALADAGYDLRMQYETKSNLTRRQLETLHRAGVVSVQPGVENLHSRVLGLMGKGVTGCQNVRLLRDASSVGTTVMWNYLYGFPGETAQDYLPVLDQFPALHHLQPMGGVARILLERFSPYVDQPELGFPGVRPSKRYDVIYDFPGSGPPDIGFLFDGPELGVDESIGQRLRDAADEWRRRYHDSRLSYLDLGDEIVLVSRRERFDWSVLRLIDPVEIAAFRLLEHPRTPETLVERLAAVDRQPHRDRHWPREWVTDLLATWVGLGVVFTETGRYLHVAPEAANQEQLRLPVRGAAVRSSG